MWKGGRRADGEDTDALKIRGKRVARTLQVLIVGHCETDRTRASTCNYLLARCGSHGNYATWMYFPLNEEATRHGKSLNVSREHQTTMPLMLN